MATYEYHDVRIVRHEYRIPYPANWVEVGKAISAARADMKASGRAEYDDAAYFEPHDDYVLLVWTQDLPDGMVPRDGADGAFRRIADHPQA